MPTRTASRSPCFALEHIVDVGDGLDDRQPRAHGALGVVLVSLRVAEVDEQAVAQVLRHVTVEALDHPGGGLLVAPEDLAPVLRIEPRRQSRRVHQIAEEHRELAALALRWPLDRPRRKRGDRLRRRHACGDPRRWAGRSTPGSCLREPRPVER